MEGATVTQNNWVEVKEPRTLKWSRVQTKTEENTTDMVIDWGMGLMEYASPDSQFVIPECEGKVHASSESLSKLAFF